MEAEAGGHRRGWIPGGGAFVGTGLGAGKALGGTMSAGQSGGAAVSGKGGWRAGSGFGWEKRLDRCFGDKNRKDSAFEAKIWLDRACTRSQSGVMQACEEWQDQIHLLERKFSAALWGLRETT